MRFNQSITLLGLMAAIALSNTAYAGLANAGSKSCLVQRAGADYDSEARDAQVSYEVDKGIEEAVLARLTPWSPDTGFGRASHASRTSRNVVTVPPGPSSTSLFLSALAGVGAWQLGRNAHKLHLGNLPEWYHAGGPSQVGASTPLDLDFSLAAMPACSFVDCMPLSKKALSPAVYRRWSEPIRRMPASVIALPFITRGPPSLA